jgi:hypothetical protein
MKNGTGYSSFAQILRTGGVGAWLQLWGYAESVQPICQLESTTNPTGKMNGA